MILELAATRIRALLWSSCALACFGCAAPGTQIQDARSYLERAVTKTDGKLSVSASVLSDDDGIEVFGARLDTRGIQPVWIKIENNEDLPFWFFPISVDPDYFPPGEVARRLSVLSEMENLEEILRVRQVPTIIPPGETVSGFVYTHSDEGEKAVNIDLFARHQLRSLHFTLHVPGLTTDYDLVDFEALERVAAEHSVDREGLRHWLNELDCCVASTKGEEGDPVNIVLVGSGKDVRSALISRGWDVTAKIDRASVWRTVAAFIFQQRYRYAPVSPLYLFGRRHDMAFQKARNIVDERNHLRLWLAPVDVDGGSVWVGQISRDIAVKLTGTFSPPTTHVIDADVDDARFYLLQDLLYSHRIWAVGYVGGAPGAERLAPRKNISGDPYFSDGLRAVFFIGEDHTPISEVINLKWELPPRMHGYHPLQID